MLFLLFLRATWPQAPFWVLLIVDAVPIPPLFGADIPEDICTKVKPYHTKNPLLTDTRKQYVS